MNIDEGKIQRFIRVVSWEQQPSSSTTKLKKKVITYTINTFFSSEWEW